MTNLIQQAQKALAAWDLQTADVTLAAQRENTVFRVEHTRGTFALRQHRQGYHTAAALKSELDWITALAAADRPVPQPIATLKGALLHTQNNQNFSLITWLPGTPMGITGTPLTLEEACWIHPVQSASQVCHGLLLGLLFCRLWCGDFDC